MVSDIKVELIYVDLPLGVTDYTLTNDVGSTSKAFIRNCVGRRTLAGSTTDTGNAQNRDVGVQAIFLNTNTIRFTRPTTGNVSSIGVFEVWRYEGSEGGDNEFIVRKHSTLYGINSATSSVSNIVDIDKVVPFLVANYNTHTSENHHGLQHWIRMNSSTELEIGKNTTTGFGGTVSYAIVEFTGSNWTISHGHVTDPLESSGNFPIAPVLKDGFDATGTTVVHDFDHAFIEACMGGDSLEEGLSDVMFAMYPNGNSSVQLDVPDTAARNDSEMYIHVIENPLMDVARANVTKSIPQRADTSLTFPTITLTDLETSAMEVYTDTNGTGTAHARGAIGMRLTSLTQITAWVHRSGNTGRYRYGVIDLSKVVPDGILLEEPDEFVQTINEIDSVAISRRDAIIVPGGPDLLSYFDVTLLNADEITSYQRWSPQRGFDLEISVAGTNGGRPLMDNVLKTELPVYDATTAPDEVYEIVFDATVVYGNLRITGYYTGSTTGLVYHQITNGRNRIQVLMKALTTRHILYWDGTRTGKVEIRNYIVRKRAVYNPVQLLEVATVDAGSTVDVTQIDLTKTIYPVTVQADREVIIDVNNIDLAKILYSPTVDVGAVIDVNKIDLNKTLNPVTVSSSESAQVDVSSGSFEKEIFPVSVTSSTNIEVNTNVTPFVFQVLSPTISTTTNISVDVNTLTFTQTLYSPTISTSTDVIVNTNVVPLLADIYSPTVEVGGGVISVEVNPSTVNLSCIIYPVTVQTTSSAYIDGGGDVQRIFLDGTHRLDIPNINLGSDLDLGIDTNLNIDIDL